MNTKDNVGFALGHLSHATKEILEGIHTAINGRECAENKIIAEKAGEALELINQASKILENLKGVRPKMIHYQPNAQP